jgi:hypothetical protein
LLELYGTSNPALRINNGTDFSDIAIASSAGAIANSSLNGALVIARGGANAINLATNGIVRATVDSAGNVGIGTTSPTGLLHLAADNAHVISKVMASTTGYDAELWLGRNDTRKAIIKAEQLSANSDHDLVFFTNGASADATEKVRITSTGNVGIGTGSPSSALEVVGGASLGSGFTQSRSGHPTFGITNGGTDSVYFSLAPNGGSHQAFMQVRDDDTDVSSVAFSTSGTERMRISSDGSCRWTPDGTNPDMTLDASGNLLVGKTSAAFGTAGVELKPSGETYVTRASATPLYVRRNTNDGDIVQFWKDGASVGSIGSFSGQTFIDLKPGSGGAGFRGGNAKIVPYVNNADADDTVDIGATAVRFKDIYATNGTIQTSDRNEKQDIEELSDAERRVAVAAKGLLRKFRWKSAVEEKGDEARIHFGIIAQDLQDAFTAEGLDAGRYGMFIHSTWTDEETGEERSRMGVRYSELLAFIIAAI